MRERWWGASGRRVSDICTEADVDLREALVLDGVDDDEALKAAHEAGRPVAVRADSADAVRAALARPEVSCALVPADRRDLLDLDLTELTYG